jgi:hypothetical protein
MLTRPGTYDLCVERIQDFSNEEDNPSPRGDKSKRVNHTELLKCLLKNQHAKFNQT